MGTEIPNDLYSNFAKWTQGHEELSAKTDDIYNALTNNLVNIGEAQDSIFNDANLSEEEKASGLKEVGSLIKGNRNTEATVKLLHVNEEKQLGLSFDFMDGKDASNEEDYDAQLTLLAQGDIDSKNTDDNQTLNFEEYARGELGDLYDVQDDEFAQQALATTQELFTSLDVDGNQELDIAEMKAFYQSIDEQDGEKDGKITLEKTFEDEDLTITIDTWDSQEKNNIDCPSRLIKNIFGVSYYSQEGQEYFKQLQEINPDLNLNNLQPGMVIKLINQ